MFVCRLTTSLSSISSGRAIPQSSTRLKTEVECLRGPKFKSRTRDTYPEAYRSFHSPSWQTPKYYIKSSFHIFFSLLYSHHITRSCNVWITDTVVKQTVNKYKYNSLSMWRHYTLTFKQQTIHRDCNFQTPRLPTATKVHSFTTAYSDMQYLDCSGHRPVNFVQNNIK